MRSITYGIKDEYGNFKLKDGSTLPETCNEAGIIIRNGSKVEISNVNSGIVTSVRGVDVIDSTLTITAEGYGIGNMGVPKYGGPTSKHEYGLHVHGKSIVDVEARGSANTKHLSFGFVAQDGYVPNNIIDLAPSAYTAEKYYVRFSVDSFGEDSMPAAWPIPMTLGEFTRPATYNNDTCTYSDGKITPSKIKLVYTATDDYHKLEAAQTYRYSFCVESYRKLTGSATLTGTRKTNRQVTAFIGATIGVDTTNVVKWMENTLYKYQWQYRESSADTWEDISGETGATYKVREDMENKQIRVVLTAHYHEGEIASSSATIKKFVRPTPGGTTLWGDANGDGSIDAKDIVILKKYRANLDRTTGTSSVSVAAGADANGDGSIDAKDIVILKKYIANLDRTTGESSVTLGPSK